MSEKNGFQGFNEEAFMRFAFNPKDTAAAFELFTGLKNHPDYLSRASEVENACRADASFMKLYNEKYCPPFPTNEELLDCAEGTLGRGLADHLISNNISVSFAGLDTSMYYENDSSIIQYLSTRAIHIHDILHVVTGFGISTFEEFYLFTVQLAQTGSSLAMLQLVSGMLHVCMEYPLEIKKYMDAMVSSYNASLEMNFLYGFPYEDHFNTDLSEVKAALSIPNLDFAK